MPLPITKGAASAQGFGEFTKTGGPALYIEDVFSTYLYTGTGAAQTITNGIDLAGQGGLVWTKYRDAAYDHHLIDTSRGVGKSLYTNLGLNQSGINASTVTSFLNNGYTLGSDNTSALNYNLGKYVSWTFRKAAKFFDIVTYTGDGNYSTRVLHNLGVTPAVIIVKRIDGAGDWGFAYLRGDVGAYNNCIVGFSLNAVTAGRDTANPIATYVSSADFQPSVLPNANNSNLQYNTLGAQYVAYLFGHDTSANGIIQCGSFTTDASGNATVNLGWEPQWLLTKTSSAVNDWQMVDAMRGFPVGSNAAIICPNLKGAEAAGGGKSPNATGFTWAGLSSTTHIYIAIRRPMKVPTDATKVFSPIVYTGASVPVTTNFPVDASFYREADVVFSEEVFSRLTGIGYYLTTPSVDAETASYLSNNYFASNTTFNASTDGNSRKRAYLNFQRAPGFFDVVCYTGTGAVRTVNHNLGVVPELMIFKTRNNGSDWMTYAAPLGATKRLLLNGTNAAATDTFPFANTTPTSTVFTVGASSDTNPSGYNQIAYLFASCPGVSKVGSYTGNGTSQTINCGFSAGARFVLVKRTDSTGDWFIWDTARGIVAANDPHLSLNTTAAEVTTDDSVDPYSAGFAVNQVAATNINVSGGTYIFLAIA